MEKKHMYQTNVMWSGNTGHGAVSYAAYSHISPEELFIFALASSQMNWYLHLCSVHHVVIMDYRDQANGSTMEREDGSRYFAQVILRPFITVSVASDLETAHHLFREARRYCFITNSVNVPVQYSPVFKTAIPM